MSVERLMDFFSSFRVVPVEIEDIRDQIVQEYKVADNILFTAVDCDPGILKGMHVRTCRLDSNKNPVNEVYIIYCGRLSVEEQRVICCKELIHILDGHVFHTNTKDGVLGLIKVLINKHSSRNFGAANLAAAKDQFALHQAIGVLVPEEMREEMAEHFASQLSDPSKKQAVIQFIARTFCIPTDYAEHVMNPTWAKLWVALRSW